VTFVSLFQNILFSDGDHKHGDRTFGWSKAVAHKCYEPLSEIYFFRVDI